jgi:hypothetical protein
MCDQLPGSVAEALRIAHAGADYLMGIWQAPLADYRVIEPSRSDRGLACQIDAFPELGAGCLRRDRRDLAGAAGTGNLFP